MEKATIEFTKQEAIALLQLIDAAVKATGMQGAEAGVVLTKKIQEAMKEEPVEKKEIAKEEQKNLHKT